MYSSKRVTDVVNLNASVTKVLIKYYIVSSSIPSHKYPNILIVNFCIILLITN